MAIDKDRLPFPLSVKIIEQPPKDRLPFTLNRKLGTIDVALPTDQTPPPKPPPKNPFKPLIAGCASFTTLPSVGVAVCHSDKHTVGAVSTCTPINTAPMHTLGRCVGVATLPFYHLANCQKTSTTKPTSLANCQSVWQVRHHHLSACTFAPVVKAVQYGGCVAVFDGAKRHFHTCQTTTTTPIIHKANCTHIKGVSRAVSSCQTHTISQAHPVPCRFYPIPEPPVPPPVSVCQIRPSSDRLPFALRRKSHQVQGLEMDALPFALTCWHDLPPSQTPNKGTYIVHNTITATIGGLTIEPLNFSIKTDMDSFCWQGSVEITSKSYERIKTKVDVERGQEALISVAINGHYFVVLCEDVSKTRSFVNHSYTLSGRSVTAHLSKDYANFVKLNNELYASQIVGEALANLPITADFGVDDWLTQATMSGTPIAIIDSVARACGGFVMSDKADGKLYIRKRYKVPAWELATTTPDHIVPLDVIKSISEQKRTNPRFNAVILTSSKEGAVVYREREGRDRHAPVSQNELYTDQACIIPAGIAILSDSGTHQTASLTMRWADKYNLPLATLGEIWQVNDKMGNADDAWRGIVQSVSIDVRVDNGVPTVWQVVGLDRYLDK